MRFLERQLTDHFRASEFRCGGGPGCACHGALLIADELVDALEEFRCVVGGPLKVNSGFRCDDHNASVGGHPRSYHRFGLAGDVTSHALRQDLEGWAIIAGQIIDERTGGEGNVIWYRRKRFIHLDTGRRISDLVREKGSKRK